MANILVENFVMEFTYNFIDKFENELYIFKIINDGELSKIKKVTSKLVKDNLVCIFL